MKYIIPLFIILILSTNLYAGDYKFAENWTWEDTVYQGIVISALVVDMGQTLYISNHPDEFYEMNPLLGKHPHQDKVIGYFVGWIVASTLTAMALTPKSRRIFQGSVIGIEAITIGRNYGVGIGMEF